MRMARLLVHLSGSKESKAELIASPNQIVLTDYGEFVCIDTAHDRHKWSLDLSLMPLSEALEELNAAMNEPVSGILNMPIFGPDKTPGREEGE